MNDTLRMALGCFGSTLALIWFTRALLNRKPTEGERVANEMMAAKARTKECGCCGKHFPSVPNDAKFFVDADMGGYYWDCECRSTLFIPCPQDLEKVA